MALIYVRSTTGSDANNGTTWALAKATLEGARLIAAAGDTIYVSQAHTQNFGTGSYDFASPGTISNPVYIVGVDDSAEPPTTLASTKPTFVSTTGNITFTGHVEYENLDITVGSGASTNSVVAGQISASPGGVIRVRGNKYSNLSTAGRPISFGNPSTGYATLVIADDCEFHLGGNAGGTQTISLGKGRVELNNCKTSATMNTPQYLFSIGSNQYGHVDLLATGCDFTSMASTLKLIRSGQNINTMATFRYCKLPTSWGESIFDTGTIPPGSRAEVVECSAGSTRIRYLMADNSGTIRSNEVNVRSGGSSYDSTPYSFKCVTNTNTNPANSLILRELPPVWISTTGSAVTLSVEVLIDSATAMTDFDMWLEGVGLTDATYMKGGRISGRKGLLASATTLASSSATWDTTGVTNVQKRTLSVTFTPQKVGFAHVRVCIAAKSLTAWVDNKVAVA